MTRSCYSLAKSCLIHFCPMVVLVIVMVFSSGCAFKKLEKEVALLNQTSILQGTISSSSSQKKPLIVLLYHLIDHNKKLVAYSIHHTPGTYQFIRLPGHYLIAAFEDANEDLVYQPTEYATYVNTSSLLTVKPGEDLLNLDLKLQPPQDVTLIESPDLTSSDTKAGLDLPKVQAGEIVTLKDRRFSKKMLSWDFGAPLSFSIKSGEASSF